MHGNPAFNNQKENIQENDARFTLAFAINGIVAIEGIVGDIEKPYGIDWFW